MHESPLTADLSALRADDPTVRHGAASRLGRLRPLPEPAVDALLLALHDNGSFSEDVGDYYGGPWYESHTVAEAVEDALRAAPIAAIAPRLLPLLGDEKPSVRRHAAHLLDGWAPAFPRLLDLLDDSAAEVRGATIEALTALHGQGDQDSLLAALLERLWDPDNCVVRLALTGLEAMRANPSLPALIRQRLAPWDERLRASLDDRREVARSHRIYVCRALALAPDDEDAAVLQCDVLLRDNDSTVLGCVAESLCAVRIALPPACVHAIFDALHQGRMAHARQWLMPLLARQAIDRTALSNAVVRYALDGEPSVIPSAPLVALISEAARGVLRSCGEAARPCVPLLVERLSSAEAVQVDRALAALGALDHLADAVLPPLIEHLRRQRDPQRVAAALETVARFGERAAAALPAILERLEINADFRVASAAVDAIAVLGADGAPACPAIADMLLGGRSRLLVLYGVRKMGVHARPLREALTLLAEADDNAEVRRLAADTLGKLGP